MKHKLLFLICICFAISSFGQIENENVLYIVDSIPIIEDPEEGFDTLTEKDIERIDIVKNEKALKATGFKDIDGIIYVFTKPYVSRSDKIKAIPTTKLMTKRNGAWYLKDDESPYNGLFIDYYLNGQKQGEGTLFNGKLTGKRLKFHLNGQVSMERHYDNGISHGTEKLFYEDGTLKQEGDYKFGEMTGIWKMYHQNGQLKQEANFNEHGKMQGETLSYYSTGELRGAAIYEHGVRQKDKMTDKIFTLYNQGQQFYKQGDFKSAIKKYSKCIELKENWVDAYFARGTARLNDFQFEEARKDFDKVLEIEPLFTNAYSNRAFVLIRKYEFGESRTLEKIKGVRVIASKEMEIPEADRVQICSDLKKAISLGDNNQMVLQALDEHCKE